MCRIGPPLFLLAFSFALPVLADVPLAGRLLHLRDPGDAAARRLAFASEADAGLAATALPDLRALGATLEIVAVGGGYAQRFVLEPDGWIGLGEPAGTRGYRFVARNRSDGVRGVVLRSTAAAGRLQVVARGAGLAFDLHANRGDLLARLQIGGQTWCLLFPAAATQVDDGTLVRARRVAAPGHCALPGCGNGSIDPGEACDDGNTAARDGCSPTCRSEDDDCVGVAAASGADLALESVAAGLFQPLWVVAPPGDPTRLLIVEQNGRVVLVRDGVLQETPFLDLRGRVSCCGERGLLSLVFHPDYATNRRFFVNYTDPQGRTVVARFTAGADPDRADAASEQVLFRVAQDFTNHNGGQLAFGPDGRLYVGMGDGGSAGDPRERAQDPASLLGKLLRVDVDVDDPPFHAVPPDNPNPAAGLPLGLVWASGLRNPWRFSFDRATGNLFLADVGQGEREEVNVQPATSRGGENYGWDVFEGSLCYDPQPHYPTCSAAPATFVAPVHEYDHGAGCSITGGFVYRGCRMPDLHGTYFYSDFCTPFVRTFQYVAGAAIRHADRTADLTSTGQSLGNVTSFGVDARGEMYLTTFGGNVWRIVPEP